MHRCMGDDRKAPWTHTHTYTNIHTGMEFPSTKKLTLKPSGSSLNLKWEYAPSATFPSKLAPRDIAEQVCMYVCMYVCTYVCLSEFEMKYAPSATFPSKPAPFDMAT